MNFRKETRLLPARDKAFGAWIAGYVARISPGIDVFVHRRIEASGKRAQWVVSEYETGLLLPGFGKTRELAVDLCEQRLNWALVNADAHY